MSWRIQLAGATEFDRIVELYREAITWLGRRGLDQWQAMVDYERRIAAEIDTGAVWVVRDPDGHIVASIRLDERADPEFWRSEDDPESALYAHRMLVSRSAAGKHLGSAMLDWASRRASETGKRWLRLDAWASNKRLHDYYQREGFKLVRLLRFEHRGSGALFQRPAGVELNRGPKLLTQS